MLDKENTKAQAKRNKNFNQKDIVMIRYSKSDVKKTANFRKRLHKKFTTFLRRAFAIQIIPLYKIRKNIFLRILYGVLLPLGLCFLIEIARISFFFESSFLDFSTSEVAANLFLLILVSLVVSIAGYVNNFHKIENLNKDRVLRVINKISRQMLSMATQQELIALICKKMEEDFGEKFWARFGERLI